MKNVVLAAVAFAAGLSNVEAKSATGIYLTAADYQRPSYVSCSTLYGADAGMCLSAAAGGLLRAVARGERPEGARVSCDR